MTVEIFTDGACSGNPGPGGWAAILRSGQHEKELMGGEKATTNNRMELTAVIEGLRALKKASAVTIHTDSRYVMDGAAKWLAGWKTKGWPVVTVVGGRVVFREGQFFDAVKGREMIIDAPWEKG